MTLDAGPAGGVEVPLLPVINSGPWSSWSLCRERLTNRRAERLEEAAGRRTQHFRLVIQDVHNDHNVSACLRTAEAFGWLKVHVVSLSTKFRPTGVARGVSEWLRIQRHTSVTDCAEQLKREGFRLVAAVARPDAISLPDITVTQPVAVIFGNEHAGLHPDWEKYIDTWMTIPMVGLVESLNISVAAAVTMFTLTQKSIEVNGLEQHYLSAAERGLLLDEWGARMAPAASSEAAPQ